MKVAHIDAFHRDTAAFWEYYRPRFRCSATSGRTPPTRPSPSSSGRGLLDGVVTQNIDRLHAAAGSRRVVEVHGSIATSSCTTCGATYELERVDALFDEDGIATCGGCMGKVKPDVVLFGEYLPEPRDGSRPRSSVRARRAAAVRRLVAGGLSRSPACPS